ncbi:hypothetical protein PCC7424_2417 [Gloeothece citriformis PCC 7424]|uniref:Uncharacterized protein n=1 Tax=Gloeothece citriformis (strain PCC 7424) TaxID=65393 RepID=B7KJ02_GLOC7|nr:hypothetical protein [Gloeothece citriformis]ACK70838.1 hypothetical protein PCC7424_2417 [Gloeothece citriformis PCC 7424]
MTQNFHKPTSTCKSCPFFEDYQDERGRGWCHAFNQPARRHHPKTHTCELVSVEPPKTVKVQLLSKAVEEDDCGYPVPVDSQIIELRVNQITRNAIEVALQSLIDLSEWAIADFWQPELESEF